MNKWLIGGAVAGVTLLGYGLIRKANAAPVKPDASVLKKARDDGFAEGSTDGAADAGKPHNPRALLNYSDIPALQAEYDNGYNDGYEKKWTAPIATPDVVKDSTPSSGGPISKGMSAYDYGCMRGSSSGRSAFENGEDGNSWAANLETDGSKKRQAESGDGPKYRQGYKECFIGAFTQAATKSALKDVSITGGFARPASFRPIQREQLWSGGQRISAVSGFGDRYRRFSSKLEQYLRPGTPLTINVVNTAGTSTAGT